MLLVLLWECFSFFSISRGRCALLLIIHFFAYFLGTIIVFGLLNLRSLLIGLLLRRLLLLLSLHLRFLLPG